MVAKRYLYPLLVLGVLVSCVIVLRLLLPSIVKDSLNGRLADMGKFHGSVAGVGIHLWRGAYSVDQLAIYRNDQPSVIFFQADSVDTSVSWNALLDGRIVADVRLVEAGIHVVGGDEDDLDDSDADVTWRQTVQEILPVQIDTLTIEDGEIHFHDFDSDPQVHLVFYQLNGEVKHLSNADRDQGAEDTNFDLRGILLDNATATMKGRLDPLGDFHDFEVDLRITGIELVKLNDVSQAYGNFDFKSGRGDFVMELKAESAQLSGYAKPVLDNVEIFDLEEDLEEGVLNAAWHAIVGAFGTVFRNDPHDRIATQIEISGDLDDPDTSAWQAFLGILKNAFVEAFESDFGRES